MIILMFGFNKSYPPLLERAINDESVRFVADSSEVGQDLLKNPKAVDIVIVNGDELGEDSAIRRFERIRLRHNCPAIIAAYAPKDWVQQAFSKRVDTDEPIIQIDCPSDACIFMPMPLDIKRLKNYLLKVTNGTNTLG